MNNTDLPPLPSMPVISPEVCETVSLYLAVSHDLTDEQKRRVSIHLQVCPQCVNEYHLVRRAAQLVRGMEGSEPSARVDIAVMAAIAAHSRSTNPSLETPRTPRPIPYNRNNARARRKRIPVGGLVAAAAVLIVALVSILHFVIMPNSARAFYVPSDAWNGVLYYTETVVTSDGKQYHIATYHSMRNDKMNVHTTMDGTLDVMAVSDGHQTVGMDMMHNVVQMNANAWLSDDSLFDLNRLNADLKSGRATYLGTGKFNGQDVYRISDNGEILLLDMQYKPVNVLQNANGSSTAKPVYDKMQMLNKAPHGTWNMTPPSGFKSGQLPAKP
ncbi:MAG: zf-HC2 domain-containing protein [Ktedonobacteraceae bacterium]|nr:zf-HC2 domain-containing protein [Ktedonobacteraceae bacterium]MBV9710932.1 zf-HC2 domain-containing protein [Ktedonobacteraceae bacterium]